MDLEMHTEKIKKLEQELAELTTAEKDDKEVTTEFWCQFDSY